VPTNPFSRVTAVSLHNTVPFHFQEGDLRNIIATFHFTPIRTREKRHKSDPTINNDEAQGSACWAANYLVGLVEPNPSGHALFGFEGVRGGIEIRPSQTFPGDINVLAISWSKEQIKAYQQVVAGVAPLHHWKLLDANREFPVMMNDDLWRQAFECLMAELEEQGYHKPQL
jgi:hypothetical protein